MPSTYPATWIERVERAPKLQLDAASGTFRAPNGRTEVAASIVAERTDHYLKAEATRRRRRLSKDDERVCREFVLIVANWQTGTWEQRTAEAGAATSKRRTRMTRTPVTSDAAAS
jgi:hypothetical protein